jgi:hypothetical protein
MYEANRLELRSDWIAAEVVGNTGATGSRASHNRLVHADSLAEFSIAPDMTQTKPQYANMYWYIKHGDMPQLSKYTYLFDIYIPKIYETAPQAIEFEVQQQVGGFVYNFAWQFPYKEDGELRTFIFNGPGNGQWVNSGVPFLGLKGGEWHHIVTNFRRTLSMTTVHESIQINKEVHLVNIERLAYRATDAQLSKYSNKLNTAFQLDLDGKITPTAYKVYIKNMDFFAE